MKCETIEKYDGKYKTVMKPKIQFNTLDSAIAHAKWINSKPETIHKLVAYKCNECHKYHVGRNGKELTDKEREKSKNFFKQY